MDKDRVEGKAKDIAGRVERQVGEWTGDKDAEAEGTGKQVEGKVQNIFGKAKDKLRDAQDNVRDNARNNAQDDESEKDVA
jgi:uncharacterized protein YjbJ (UPF0337 family)